MKDTYKKDIVLTIVYATLAILMSIVMGFVVGGILIVDVNTLIGVCIKQIMCILAVVVFAGGFSITILRH